MKVWVVRKDWIDIETKMHFHKTKVFMKKSDAEAFYLEKTNGWSEMCNVTVIGAKAKKRRGAK